MGLSRLYPDAGLMFFTRRGMSTYYWDNLNILRIEACDFACVVNE